MPAFPASCCLSEQIYLGSVLANLGERKSFFGTDQGSCQNCSFGFRGKLEILFLYSLHYGKMKLWWGKWHSVYYSKFLFFLLSITCIHIDSNYRGNYRETCPVCCQKYSRAIKQFGRQRERLNLCLSMMAVLANILKTCGFI